MALRIVIGLIVMSNTFIQKLECIGNWVKNDLIRDLYVAKGDEIMDISCSDGDVYNYA